MSHDSSLTMMESNMVAITTRTTTAMVLVATFLTFIIMIQSSYAQFFNLPEEPITEPTTTTPVSQGNSTSSGVGGGDPTIISLDFLPDGTGWLTLDINGTLSPIIGFNHSLTPANGYRFAANTLFHGSNGTQVDVNSIDFSSQVTIDPNANVTLPAKPNISPDAVQQYGPLPPIPSTQTSSTSPQQSSQERHQQLVEQHQRQQQQQTSSPQLQPALTSDPELLRFNEMFAQCQANIEETNPLGEQGEFVQPSQSDLDDVNQCVTALKQAVIKFCEDFETYDAAKCSYVNKPSIKQWLDAAERIVLLGTGLNIMTQ
jgi:hypothetical protein